LPRVAGGRAGMMIADRRRQVDEPTRTQSGTVSNFVFEAIVMETKGTSYGY
jgi:hypothetical protein